MHDWHSWVWESAGSTRHTRGPVVALAARAACHGRRSPRPPGGTGALAEKTMGHPGTQFKKAVERPVWSLGRQVRAGETDLGIIGIQLVGATGVEEFIPGGSADRGNRCQPQRERPLHRDRHHWRCMTGSRERGAARFKGPDAGQRSREKEPKRVLGCDNQAATGSENWCAHTPAGGRRGSATYPCSPSSVGFAVSFRSHPASCRPSGAERPARCLRPGKDRRSRGAPEGTWTVPRTGRTGYSLPCTAGLLLGPGLQLCAMPAGRC